MAPVEVRAKLREVRKLRDEADDLRDEYRRKHSHACMHVKMLEDELQRLMTLHPTYKRRKPKNDTDV